MNMRKIIALAVAVLVGCSSVFAAMPERTPHNVEKYKKICRENIQKEKKGMYREPKGSLKYKFITPGCMNKGFQNWNLLVLNMIAWLDGRDEVREF